MSIDIKSIERKLLIKYPTFGSTISNLKFQESKDVETLGTDGKVVLYNPKFINNLSEKQQIFVFAHEVCHVAFEHIFRSEGKDKRLWNIATDAVINALLQQDGLPIVKGGVDLPEAINYDAEEMYNKLLEKQKKEQEKQNNQNGQERQDSQSGQGQQSSQEGQEENDAGQDTHSLWEKAIEERKKEKKQNSTGNKDKEGKENDVGQDTHSLWEKAIEERKKGQKQKTDRK